VMTGEDLQVARHSYDIVYLANVIHHVHDRERLFAGIDRALKPGGRFFSIDPVAYNPVINRYRSMATEVRTEDEGPPNPPGPATRAPIFSRSPAPGILARLPCAVR
jgi:SAM-dependent methyltransferase